jgi:7-cyano-7-deazaguanine synthase in queuosine biosynthesis
MKRWAEVYHPDADVKCVYYNIGQPYAYKEEAVLPSFVERLKLDWLMPDEELHGKSDSQSGNIIIAGRNLVLATAAACKYLPDQVWMGALLGETHAGSTDKNWEFLSHATKTLSYVLSPFKPEGIDVRFPLAQNGLNKLTATKWALKHGISAETIQSTSSCLSGEAGNCGRCVVCFRRWGIFKQLGLHEEYNTHPLEWHENLKIAEEMIYGSHYDAHRKAEILPALPEWYLKVIENGWVRNNGNMESS